MSDFAEFKDDINRTAVSAELLGEVMMMYGEIAPEERGFEARAERVVALLTKKGHGEKPGPLAMAIMIRLMALDAILADKEVQDWTLPGAEPGVTYVHSALLTRQLSATCPPNDCHRRSRVRPVALRSIFPLCPSPIASPRRGTDSHRPTAPTRRINDDAGIAGREVVPPYRISGRNGCIGVFPDRMPSR